MEEARRSRRTEKAGEIKRSPIVQENDKRRRPTGRNGPFLWMLSKENMLSMIMNGRVCEMLLLLSRSMMDVERQWDRTEGNVSGRW